MNKKLIAAAVSAAVVAPVAGYGEVQVYGRINNAIDLNDLADEGDSQTDVSGVSSRFGIKYNKEMGNGLSAHGRYEFSTFTDNERGINDIRISTVGVSGPFGRVDIGNQWSAYFDTFGTLISPTYTLGYYLYSSIGGGPFRASNTIKYSNSFGPLYLELDVRLNDESSPEGGDVAEKINGDGVGLGLSWAVSDNLTIAAAFDAEDEEDDSGPATVVFTGAQTTANDDIFVDDDTTTASSGSFGQDQDRWGIAAKGTFGNFWVSVGWQNHEYDDIDIAYEDFDLDDDGTVEDGTVAFDGLETETYFIYGGGKFGENTSWMLGYAEADDGVSANQVNIRDGKVSTDTDDSSQVIWALYHSLGGGLKLYYEAISLDSDNLEKDGDRHLIGMRVDF